MTATHLRRLWHRIGQALVVGLGWLGFAWMWLLVLQRPWEVRGLVWLIGGSLVVLPFVTLFWVRHNRSIHHRKGPRRAIAVVREHYVHDWSGRVVQADWSALHSARSITVHISDGVKRFRFDAAPAPVPAQVRRERVFT